jgi:hypothetical protein
LQKGGNDMLYSEFLLQYDTKDYDYENLPSIMFGDDTKEYIEITN